MSEHKWKQFEPGTAFMMIACSVCGVCKRADGNNNPCPGVTPAITTREVLGDKLSDERRAELLERAPRTLAELRRQQRAGYDSWERFDEERDTARLLIEQEAELRARRQADLSAEDREALEWLLANCGYEDDGNSQGDAAMEVVSRLLAQGGGR